MVNTTQLDQELTRFTELRRRLIEADPEIDETTLLDTLEGATSLHEAIGVVVRAALIEEALAAGLKGRLAEMRERLSRLELGAEKKRKVALDAMEEAGLEKVLEPDFTLSLRTTSPSVVVTDEALIPEWFWVPQEPKLDRRRLLDTLKAGTMVAGACLSNAGVCLSVRAK